MPYSMRMPWGVLSSKQKQKTRVCKTSSSLEEDHGEGAGEKHVLVCVLPQQATTYESVSWIIVMTDSDPPLRRMADVGPEPPRALMGLSPAGTSTMLNILNCTDITGNYPSEKHMIHSQQKCGHRMILSNLTNINLSIYGITFDWVHVSSWHDNIAESQSTKHQV